MSQSSVHSPQMQNCVRQGTFCSVLIQNSLLKKQTHESNKTSSPFPLCGARLHYPREGGWVRSAPSQFAEVLAPSELHLHVTSPFAVASTRQVLHEIHATHAHMHTHMHVHMHVHRHMHACSHKHMHTHMYAQILTCTLAHARSRAPMHTYTREFNL